MALIQTYDAHMVINATVDETNGIDAGQLVKSVATDSVMKVALADTTGDDALVVGVALIDQDDEGMISVACDGVFGFTAGGTITTGAKVVADVSVTTAVAVLTASAGDSETKVIGKALTYGTSGDTVYVRLNI